jgi:Ca2+-binding EF-hand superfamily protein
LQILLPCDDAFLRAAATQRPNYKLQREEYLPMRVEKALTNLLVKELKLQMKAENLKRNLEQSYDFQVGNLFKAVDDWHYTYIDEKNLRRFLRNVGHLSSKQELVAIIRRIDTDGDAKVNLEEFAEGIRS